jgi:hypothetical protein
LSIVLTIGFSTTGVALLLELWYYKNDPTHICFFSKQTMRYLAQQWGVKVKFFANNVVLFVNRFNNRFFNNRRSPFTRT